jgi:hypothetical protein
MPTRTKYIKSVLDNESANELFQYLKNSIQWQEGIRSRKGFTRKAKPLEYGENTKVDNAIDKALQKFKNKYNILGVYLNYYEDGNMWTPNHTHKGTQQLVLSLGCKCDLIIGKNTFTMENGSAIIFGSSIHGVPKDPSVTQGRISIATFMTDKLTIPRTINLNQLNINNLTQINIDDEFLAQITQAFGLPDGSRIVPILL